MDEIVYRVRKDGRVKVSTKRQAVQIIAAARTAGYNFGQRQEFGGFVVSDLDD